MNLLIPTLALALVAVALLFAIGKLLGGHSAAREDPGDRAPSRPPAKGPSEAILPPSPSASPVLPPSSGASSDAQRFEHELRELVAEGKLIHAIKRYREAYGVNLREAKEAIDRLRAGEPLPSGPAPQPAPAGDPADDPELRDALARGKKILAIKRYRELTGCSLKEAKDAVEAL